MRKSDYRKFYTCPNKGLLTTTPGYPEGYITKDGMWAAVPVLGSKTKLQIIHNGTFPHVARNYPSAVAYIKKEIAKEKKKNK
jgi:hypothetical protein